MRTLALSAQTETESAESAVEALEAGTVEPAPLLTGPAPALWAGFGAFILIFIIGMMLIIRGRVTRPRQSEQAESSRTFFEPAGDSADITFDEDAEFQPEPARKDTPEDAEPAAAHPAHENGSLMRDEPQVHPEPETEPSAKKKSAFANLFARKKREDKEPPPETEAFAEAEEHGESEEADIRIIAEEPAPPEPEPRSDPPAAPGRSYASENRARADKAEEAAHAAMTRAEQAEALAADLKRANDEARDAMVVSLKKKETALEERADALLAMENRLSALSDEFTEKLEIFEAAGKSNPAQALSSASHETEGGVSEAHFAEFADLMGEQFEALRNAVTDSIARLSQRLNQLPTGPAPATPTAARIQLSDLLRDALAPKQFRLAHKLANGRTADALIVPPKPAAPIAMDARFPTESFDAWRLSRSPATETELRRAALRHIADAAEKLIAPGETAESAMIFVPSEQILSELHAHFSDVVQESYRARVWMVSPTSLMATLHTISAVLSAVGGDKDAGHATLVDEINTLQRRIAALEAERRNGPGAEPGAASKPAQYADVFSPAAARLEDADEKPAFPLR